MRIENYLKLLTLSCKTGKCSHSKCRCGHCSQYHFAGKGGCCKINQDLSTCSCKSMIKLMTTHNLTMEKKEKKVKTTKYKNGGYVTEEQIEQGVIDLEMDGKGFYQMFGKPFLERLEKKIKKK